MPLSDDLTTLFTAQPTGPATPMRYRQGTILTWNPITLENTVIVGNATYTNLPVLGAAEAASYREGTTVGITVIDSTWAIIGRFCIPGTADALDAITQIGQRATTATVTTLEATTSSPYVDLATPGPTVSNIRIPASGKAEVVVSSQIDNLGPGTLTVATVGVEISGDASIAPNTLNSLIFIASSGAISVSKTLLFESLPAGGVCSFKLKYGSNGTVNTQFGNRTILVRTL